MNNPTAFKRGTSLGLLTPTSFELKLLEVALKGKSTFETEWDEKCASYDTNMQVMSHEILHEIMIWEKNGSVKTLQERARALVVKMKNTNLHSRALVVYRVVLDRGRPPVKSSDSKLCQDVGTEFSSKVHGTDNSSQVRERVSFWFSSQIPDSTEFSSTQVPSTSDEKFNRMLNIELPFLVDELDDDSSTAPKEPGTATLQGEPSICEPSTSDDFRSCEGLSIFEKPTETGEGVTCPLGDDQLIFDLSLNHEPSDRESIIFLHGNEDTITPGSECKWQREGWSEYDDVKRDLGENPFQLPAKLGNFPGKDFQFPIEWTLDKTIYRANSLSGLRRNYVVLIEGTFRKRCRAKIWRDYYGFFLDMGVMIYFRNKIYKKVADFRKCIVTMLKNKPLRLNVQDVCFDTKQTDWLLEFNNAKRLTVWYQTIVRFSKRMPLVGFSKGLKTEAFV